MEDIAEISGRLESAPSLDVMDQAMLENIEWKYSGSIPPFDRFSDAMGLALRKTLDELGIATGQDERNRLLMRSFSYFMQELKSDKRLTLENIREASDRCRRCESVSGPVVHSQGSPEAMIILVGEAPGEEEERRREPFVGKAGELLKEYLVAAELTGKNLLYTTNICRCRPPTNRLPLVGEIRNCFPWLLAEIDVLCPVVIVTLGATASKAFLGPKCGKLEDIHGKMYCIGAQVIMPTYHPSAVLRGQKQAEQHIQHDLSKLYKLVETLA
jgi:uracil-DNA glycosylase family 4